jgi:hypothetical protein
MASGEGPVARTTAGPVQGTVVDGIAVFKGLPYLPLRTPRR